MVSSPSRWLDQVCREPSQEVSGYLSPGLRMRGLAESLARTPRRGAVLDRSRSAHLPRGQPAHQAVSFLGMADLRGPGAVSGYAFPGRGVHATQGNGLPGEMRFFAVVYLFYLAQH